MTTETTPPNTGPDVNPDAPDPGEPFSRFLQLLRGSVRPVVTLALAWTFIVAVLIIVLTMKIPEAMAGNIVAAFLATVGTVLGVWFGQRNR